MKPLTGPTIHCKGKIVRSNDEEESSYGNLSLRSHHNSTSLNYDQMTLSGNDISKIVKSCEKEHKRNDVNT